MIFMCLRLIWWVGVNLLVKVALILLVMSIKTEMYSNHHRYRKTTTTTTFDWWAPKLPPWCFFIVPMIVQRKQTKSKFLSVSYLMINDVVPECNTSKLVDQFENKTYPCFGWCECDKICLAAVLYSVAKYLKKKLEMVIVIHVEKLVPITTLNGATVAWG